MQLDYVVFELCERTDRETDVPITILRPLPAGWGQSNS